MEEVATIQVLVVEPEQSLPGRQAVPLSSSLAARIVDVPVPTFRDSIQKVTEQITELLRDMPNKEGLLQLDEISVGLTVAANGSVHLVGGLGVEVSSTFTLTYKVANSGNDER